MSTSSAQLDADLARLHTDAALLHTVIHGDTSTIVETEGGPVRSMSSAIASITAINFRGAWQAATAYAEKDAFSYSGIVYVSVLAHVSTTIDADLAAGKIGLYQGVIAPMTKIYTAPGDFTPGTTAGLTLPYDPGSKENVVVHFGANYQGPNQYDVAGVALTFNAAIPDGVTEVFVRIGMLQSTVTPSSESVGDKQLVWGATLGRVVDTIADLKALDGTRYKRAFAVGYGVKGKGGGRYWQDEADAVTPDNGVTCIVADDGKRWKLIHNGTIALEQAGGVSDNATDDSVAWARLLAIGGIDIVFSGPSIVSGQVTPTADNISIRGLNKSAVIRAKPGSNFEYLFRAVGRSGIKVQGVTFDANQANRVGALTSRAVAFDYNDCTDCSVDDCVFIGAIGDGTIPGVCCALSGTGSRNKVTRSMAKDGGVVGKAADGFYCSASDSLIEGSTAVNCLDTAFVLESCNGSGIAACRAVGCSVGAAVTNAIGTDTYGNYINGLSITDWDSSVTGGIQIAALAAGNLLGTLVEGVVMQGINSFVGPAVEVRKASTGVVNGLDLDVTVRNASAQGILIDSALDVSVKAKISGTTDAAIQVQGNSEVFIQPGTNIKFAGTFAVIALGTSQVTITGARIDGGGVGAIGIWASGTAVVNSMMNDILHVSSQYQGYDAGATLNTITMIGGRPVFGNREGVPPAGSVTSRVTLADNAGNGAGAFGVLT